MEGPGRPSTASLSVAPVASWQRIEPPDTLSEPQKALWRAITATKPSEWFKADCAAVLEAYVQAIDAYRRTAAAQALASPDNVREYKVLTELMLKQSNSVAQLAAKLRLTPQSRYTTISAATADRKTGEARKPWERKTG